MGISCVIFGGREDCGFPDLWHSLQVYFRTWFVETGKEAKSLGVNRRFIITAQVNECMSIEGEAARTAPKYQIGGCLELCLRLCDVLMQPFVCLGHHLALCCREELRGVCSAKLRSRIMQSKRAAPFPRRGYRPRCLMLFWDIFWSRVSVNKLRGALSTFDIWNKEQVKGFCLCLATKQSVFIKGWVKPPGLGIEFSEIKIINSKRWRDNAEKSILSFLCFHENFWDFSF